MRNEGRCRGWYQQEADVGVRRDCHEGGVAHAALDLRAQLVPVEALLAGDLREIDLHAAVALQDLDRVERAPCPWTSGAFEMPVAAAFACEVGALVDRHVAYEFEEAVGEVPCVRALVAHRELLERVGKSHDAEAHGAILLVGLASPRGSRAC